MVQETYLDTYALVEISLGNPKFTVLQESPFVIHELTLVEFYTVILRKYNRITADYWVRKLYPYTQNCDLSLLIKAAIFKVENSNKDFSFFDAIGYIFARENDLTFVTGDEEFRGFKGVELIKK